MEHLSINQEDCPTQHKNIYKVAVRWKFGYCSACTSKNMMNNYAWTLIIWWKRKSFIYFIKCYWIKNLLFIVIQTGVDTDVFNISIPILGTLIWACQVKLKISIYISTLNLSFTGTPEVSNSWWLQDLKYQ